MRAFMEKTIFQSSIKVKITSKLAHPLFFYIPLLNPGQASLQSFTMRVAGRCGNDCRTKWVEAVFRKGTPRAHIQRFRRKVFQTDPPGSEYF